MFKLVRIQNAQMNVPEPEYVACGADLAIEEGQALSYSAGKLSVATTTVPTFIAAKTITAGATDVVPVFRVEPQQVWEATGVGAVVAGNKYTIDATGLTITTTTGNAALVTEVYGSTAHVMFR